ncbi:hypothetical protein [Wolbachia endosymbiont (group B) of Apotomis betuletana]|uniref:hypothetical protein n=1 Tax=Wolbachia endosymbiont (group B) of Apotomis betuletana TaxID=2953982 RepID=UPI0022264A24|nr:hypothetical protein [Wolbachia endosymbiont (group B) of Apotomis betuletana]
MSNNIYSDQVDNSNLYANKLFYDEEGEQVENLGDQVAGKEDDKLEEDLLRDCRDETKKAKDKLIQCKKDAVESQREITKLEAEASELKSQVQEEREKVEQTKNEAEAKVDKLKLQVQEEREKVEQTKNEAEAKVDELKLQVQEEKGKVEQTKNETEAAKAEVDELKLQVQKEREKVEQTKNEAKEAKDELIQCKKDAEKMKEGSEQAINQAKYDDAQAEAKQAKLEAKQAKLEAKQAKLEAEQARIEALRCEIGQEREEVMRCKIDKVKEELMQYKIDMAKAENKCYKKAAEECKKEKGSDKEELIQCKIDTAKAETEWYKKEAEECKKEKGSGTDKPCPNGGGGTNVVKPVTNGGGDETNVVKPVTNGGGDETNVVKPVTNGGRDENREITSQKITPDCSKEEICGSYARFYGENGKIGYQGFNTSDLLKNLYSEMYGNPKIAPYIEKGAEGGYGAVNFKFAFTDTLSSIGYFSDIKCDKCINSPQELACQEEGIKSFCYSNDYYATKECNKNFFSRESCPDLVKEFGEINVMKAKQVAPLILVNNSGQMIDKEGNNTQIHYNLLKPYLKANGKIKDCGNDQKCKDYIPIMKKVAWDTDKEVLLKTVFDDMQRASPYYEDNPVSDDTNFI